MNDTPKPVFLTLSCDSLDEARAIANEALDELRLTMEENDLQYGLSIPFKASNVGVRFPADSPYETSIEIFPLRDGEALTEYAETFVETLLTLDRSRVESWPAPSYVKSLLAYVLMDVLPCAEHVHWHEIDEQFAGGTSPIVLLNNIGIELDTRIVEQSSGGFPDSENIIDNPSILIDDDCNTGHDRHDICASDDDYHHDR